MSTNEARYKELILLSLTAPNPELFVKAANLAQTVRQSLSKDARKKVENDIELRVIQFEQNFSKCLNRLEAVS